MWKRVCLLTIFLSALAYTISQSQTLCGDYDTLYLIPINTTLPPAGSGTVEFQFRFKTDNHRPYCDITSYAVFAKYRSTNHDSKLQLDTDTNYIVAGSIIENCDIKGFQLHSGSDSSGVFSFYGINFSGGIESGEYLVGSIRFYVTDTTTICIDTTFIPYTNAHTIFGIELAVEIPFYWQPGGYTFAITRQAPAVPALNQWGAIAFCLAITAALIIYLRRRFSLS